MTINKRYQVCIVNYCCDGSKCNNKDLSHQDAAPIYGLVIGLVLLGLVLFVIGIQQIKRYLSNQEERKRQLPSSLFRFSAFCRGLHYHCFRIKGWQLPHTVPLIMLTTLFVWMTVWILGTLPYYSHGFENEKPPLATRAGSSALALIPFIFTSGSRFNPISLATGISHEKLQVFHQYGARILLFISVLHGIPMLVQPYLDGKRSSGGDPAAGRTAMQEAWDNNPHFESGTVLIVLLVWINISSMRFFRRLHYEFFVFQHVIITIAFLANLFPHSNVTYMDSWNYLFASVALIIWSWLGRLVLSIYCNKLSTAHAQLENLNEGMTRISLKTHIKWKPGQYIYLRFPFMKVLQSHPFTITTIPSTDSDTSVIQILARAKGGITRKLYDRAKQGKTHIPVFIDGPYGGPNNLKGYKHILLLSGGTGVTCNFPLLLDLVRKMENGETECELIDFVWSVRSRRSIEWFEPSIRSLSRLNSYSNVKIRIHVTGDKNAPPTSSSIATSISDVTATSSINNIEKELYQIVSGRFDIEGILNESSRQAQGKSLGVSLCGPKEFNFEVMNHISKIQFGICQGDTCLPNRLYAHSENFSA